DFGAVGRIHAVSREALQGIAFGFAVNDGSIIARAVRHMMGDAEHIDMRQLERDLSVLLGEAQSSGVSAAAMVGVSDVIDRPVLRPARSMMILSRALITVEGTLRGLDSSFELGSEATDLVATDHREELGTPQELLQRELIHALPALRSLPDHA